MLFVGKKSPVMKHDFQMLHRVGHPLRLAPSKLQQKIIPTFPDKRHSFFLKASLMWNAASYSYGPLIISPIGTTIWDWGSHF